MTNEPARPDPNEVTAPVAIAPVTGVAQGNLGTASNLEDTQVFRIADLVDETGTGIVPPVEPPAPVTVEPVTASRPPRPARRGRPMRPRMPFTRTAGLVAAAAAIAIGSLAALSTGSGSLAGTGQADPSSPPYATAAPTADTAQGDEAGGEKGKGKGKGDNGNGKGHGH